MKVLIIGAAGMIGRKLCQRLARDGRLAGKPIEEARLVDIVAPAPIEAPFPVSLEACDIAAAYVPPKLAAGRPDMIFLLASVVSGEAEADFDKGYAINLGGTHALFEAIRREHILSGGAYRPRLIFTSSIAVYGAPFPDVIGDDFLAAPLTSYGTQKAMCELMLGDYSRRGFFDGIGSGCRPSASGPALRTGRRRASSRASFASRSRERRRSCRSATTSAIGTPRPGRRSASSCTPRNSTAPTSAPGGRSTCPACRRRSASRSRPCGASPATRRRGLSAGSPTRRSGASSRAGREPLTPLERRRSVFVGRRFFGYNSSLHGRRCMKAHEVDECWICRLDA